LLACLLFLGLSLDAAAGNLYTNINRLRAGAGDCLAGKQLPPLQPQAALERVAGDLARGNEMQRSLKAAGYRATRSSALWFKGEGVGAQVLAALAKRGYCEKLQDAAVTEIGIFQDARQIWIVMAAPFAPAVEVSEQAAGLRLLELVNHARATPRDCGSKAFNAAPPLRWNDALAESARLHAGEMAHYDYFSHSGRDGSSPGERVERAGYRYLATGENIAAGQMRPEDAMAAWLNSPEHCANLMNPAFTEMGVAFAVEAKSRMGVYWTQTFGRPR
jgi:uncharacterized protein YkwD